ncbi:MAG: hypothetical protein CM1200mP29_12500 [Verrucomicrobiota bacterium]|nr:MAG: hypothetical protein CM1200mP29_12500 [Verrucomicrobiota bacterium]
MDSGRIGETLFAHRHLSGEGARPPRVRYGVRALKIGKNSGRDYWVGVRHWLVGNEIMLRWGLKSGSSMSGDGRCCST